jgi:hypothetical protein
MVCPLCGNANAMSSDAAWYSTPPRLYGGSCLTKSRCECRTGIEHVRRARCAHRGGASSTRRLLPAPPVSPSASSHQPVPYEYVKRARALSLSGTPVSGSIHISWSLRREEREKREEGEKRERDRQTERRKQHSSRKDCL